jgi:hypothetical protein
MKRGNFFAGIIYLKNHGKQPGGRELILYCIWAVAKVK